MGYLNKREQIYKLDRVGRMDRRITIIKKDITDGDSNEDKVESWSEFDTVWARKEDLRGKEVVMADKVQFMYLTSWSIRKLAGVKADMRIVYKGQVFEIVQISEGEGRERWLDLITNLLENEYWS
jgi:SPP1 family predicted phage head-tail adaptor